MNETRCMGCGDWQATRRGILAPAVQAVPIPGEVLAERGAIRRREFLAGAGLIALASGLAACGGSNTVERVLENAAAAHDPNAPILVSLYLEGGNDGLNTLVPLREPRYHALRTRLAIAEDSLLPLGDGDDFGWNPALSNIARLYRAGKVAVLPSVDYAQPDLSHFNSAEYWRTGIVGHTEVTTGWLGRAIDVVGTADNPLQAISVQDRLDPVLASARVPIATVQDPSGYSFWVEGIEDEAHVASFLRDLERAEARFEGLAAARRTYGNVVRVRDQLGGLGGETRPMSAYPDSDLGRAFAALGRMLGAGFGTRFAAVADNGGYDTHEAQGEHHEKLLTGLDEAVGAWQRDLERRGLADRVLTLIWSEFGRRPADNESNGTDHGAGGLVLLVGNRANGGIRSEFPGLAKLDEDDNMLVSTEFRAVYATLLEDWMGIDAEQVLPGVAADRLPLVSAA